MHRPAPGGKVRSADADTETISETLTFMKGLQVDMSPDFDERVGDNCRSALLICRKIIIFSHGKILVRLFLLVGKIKYRRKRWT